MYHNLLGHITSILPFVVFNVVFNNDNNNTGQLCQGQLRVFYTQVDPALVLWYFGTLEQIQVLFCHFWVHMGTFWYFPFPCSTKKSKQAHLRHRLANGAVGSRLILDISCKQTQFLIFWDLQGRFWYFFGTYGCRKARSVSGGTHGRCFERSLLVRTVMAEAFQRQNTTAAPYIFNFIGHFDYS